MDVPYNGLIVAIDYGTTFTGIAFQPTVWDQDDADLAKSTVVTKWSDKLHEAKVPSQISYSANLDGRLQWGREITAGSRPMIWTKLQLDQQDDRLADLKGILDSLEETENLDPERVRREWRDPTHLTKEPIDIIADYLREVRVAAVREIKAAIGHTVVPRLVTDIVITVPAIWSDTAKNLTFRAVNKAGFTKRYFNGLRDVIFVTEPEAAALYSIKSIIDRRADDEVIGVGDCFIQADLGGGTVDVISYRVEAIQPALRLRQVGLASGYKCGATFVDREFLAWLERRLGDDYQRIFPPTTTHAGGPDNSIHELLEMFEQMRRNLDATGNLKMEHQVIRLKGRDFVDLTLPGKGVEGGRILVTSEEMRSFFQYSLSNINGLIASQMSEIDRAGYSTQYVFLSGGFAESNYIHQEVQVFCGQRGVQVCRPDRPLIAVCKGAIATVQEQVADSRIRMRESSRSFGIVLSQPFSPYLHADQTGYDDPFEQGHKVREQIIWLIKKGDLLLSNEEKHVHIEFCRRFGPNDPKVFINRFVSSISDNPPSSLAEFEPDQRNITSVQYDLEPISDQLEIDGERDYLTARLRAGISLGKKSQWYMSFKGTTLVTVPLDSIA